MPSANDVSLLVAELHEAADEEQTVDSVLDCALQVVGCASCGVMLVHGRRIETSGVPDQLVARADELQMLHDDGPCLSAIRDDATYLIDDTSVETRWSTWCREVADLGYRSVMGVRIGDGATPLGAINFYAHERAAFDDEDVALAQILARHAGIALTKVRHGARLEQAIDGRTFIGQAQGILMERYDLDADQAFAVLRRYSQHANVRLREIARQVAQSRELPAFGEPEPAADIRSSQ